MQRLQARLSGVESAHDEVVVALFGPEQLHFSIDTIDDAFLGAAGDLSYEEVGVEIRYFFVDVRSV